jgi:hypothetical protein
MKYSASTAHSCSVGYALRTTLGNTTESVSGNRVKIPIVVDHNRLRGKSTGALVYDTVGHNNLTLLRLVLRDEARAAGIEVNPAWLGTSVLQILKIYEEQLAKWQVDKQDTVGFVFEGLLPSGRSLLLGEPRALALVGDTAPPPAHRPTVVKSDEHDMVFPEWLRSLGFEDESRQNDAYVRATKALSDNAKVCVWVNYDDRNDRHVSCDGYKFAVKVQRKVDGVWEDQEDRGEFQNDASAEEAVTTLIAAHWNRSDFEKRLVRSEISDRLASLAHQADELEFGGGEHIAAEDELNLLAEQHLTGMEFQDWKRSIGEVTLRERVDALARQLGLPQFECMAKDTGSLDPAL